MIFSFLFLTVRAAQALTCAVAFVDETNAEASEVNDQVAILLKVAESGLYKNFAFVVVDGAQGREREREDDRKRE